MTDEAAAPDPGGPIRHIRWSRTRESGDYFIDEDRLRGCFICLTAGDRDGASLALLAVGLWRLQRSAALTPPVFIGVAHGLIFSGRPEPIGSVREEDFDLQLSDTVEVLFGRTEKGLPPAIRDFCAPDVVAAVDQAYQESAAKYPAGYVQTLELLESKVRAARTGYRRVFYHGLLASRSVAAAQTSPIYLDCTFIIRGPTPLNAVGWRLVHLDAIGRETTIIAPSGGENAVRQTLELPHAP